MRDKVRNKLKKRKAEEDEDDSDRMKTKERLETRLVNKKGRHYLTLGSFIGKWVWHETAAQSYWHFNP